MTTTAATNVPAPAANATPTVATMALALAPMNIDQAVSCPSVNATRTNCYNCGQLGHLACNCPHHILGNPQFRAMLVEAMKEEGFPEDLE